MPNDRLRQAANLLFALGQLVIPGLLFAGGFDLTAADPGQPVEPNPATPAGYAFAIWSVIYVGAAAYAVLQALPGRAVDPLFRRLGWLTALGYGLCCAWLYFARFGPVWATVPIIVVMLLALGAAFVIATREAGHMGRVRRIVVVTPLAIYTGWLSAATFVNAADVLPGYGFDRFGLTATEFGLLVIAASAVTAAALTLLSRANLAYVAAILWALVSIVAANGLPALDNLVSLAATVAAAAVVVLAIVERRRSASIFRRPTA